LSEADSAVSELSGIGQLLPNPHLFTRPYIKQESVLSSRIEGTMASLSDLYLSEISDKKPKGYMKIKEVKNHVIATERALKIIRKKKLSLTLIKEIHRILLRGVRGEDMLPGEFRKLQNWIGKEKYKDDITKAIFVPPTWKVLPSLLKNFEEHLQNPSKEVPILTQCALMHYQFETIHPFFDGNGRIGRLLIILYLIRHKKLSQPLLYLSSYLEEHQDEYYAKLNKVRETSNYLVWVKFFLKAVKVQAKETNRSVQKIIKLQKRYETLLRKSKSNVHTIRLLRLLFLNPYVTTNDVAKHLKVTFPTAQSTIKK